MVSSTRWRLIDKKQDDKSLERIKTMIIVQKVTERSCKNVKVKWIIFFLCAKGCAWEIS